MIILAYIIVVIISLKQHAMGIVYTIFVEVPLDLLEVIIYIYLQLLTQIHWVLFIDYVSMFNMEAMIEKMIAVYSIINHRPIAFTSGIIATLI